MRVLVVGSDKHLESDADKDAFKAFCRKFGSIGARKGFEFVVGSEAIYAPDRYIVEGANEADKQTNVHVISTRNRNFPFQNDVASESRINFIPGTLEGQDWDVARVKQILESDVVVTVGGGGSTKSAAHVARFLQKPVLITSSFGGASEGLVEQFEDDYEKLPQNHAPIFRKFLYAKVHDDLPLMAIKNVETLAKNNPYVTPKRGKSALLVAYIISLCVLWVATFFKPVEPLSFSLFLLLGISSFLGSSLRASIKSKVVSHSELSVADLAIDTMTGVLVSFFLCLIYMLGGITVKGDLLFLSSAEDFQRIGLTVSLLGASSSFLVEKSVAKLKESLSGILK